MRQGRHVLRCVKSDNLLHQDLSNIKQLLQHSEYHKQNQIIRNKNRNEGSQTLLCAFYVSKDWIPSCF
jgi:hypothetical protein